MSSVLEQRALKWIPLALAAAVTLAGCARDGYYHDRNLDYTEAAPAPQEISGQVSPEEDIPF